MIEIERKFLINKKLWKPKGKGIEIRQGYLSVDPERVVRVRIAGKQSFLTIKGKANGIVRTEMEYEIPKTEADILMKMCLDYTIEKTRFIEGVGDLNWEIDVFEGNNKGLIIAEVELEDEFQKIEFPEWITDEVSNDPRFYNSFLSRNPFLNW